MAKKKLSVIIPNYNHGRYLPLALEAIVQQSYQPFEVIIIDDGSTDNSRDIIKNYQTKYPYIRSYFNEKNMGAAYTSELLLQMVRGDYIYASASDDFILPHFFSKSMSLLCANPFAGLCSSLRNRIDPHGNKIGIEPSIVAKHSASYLPPEEVKKRLVLHGTWILASTTIYRKKALLEAGGFIKGLHSFSDGLITKVIALKYGACYVPEVLTTKRVLEENFSNICCLDPKLLNQIMTTGYHLMNTRYRDIFPEDYISIFKRQIDYDLLQCKYKNYIASPDTLLLKKGWFKLLNQIVFLQRKLSYFNYNSYFNWFKNIWHHLLFLWIKAKNVKR